MRNSLNIQLDRLASDRWARRGVRILVRSVWLGLSLCCVGLGASLLLGMPLRWQWLAALGLTCVAGGALLVLRPRMSAGEVARRLDRRFQLNEQIATALELGASPTGVETYLLEESRRSIGQIRRYTGRRQGFPWAEVGLIIALLIVLGGMAILLGIGGQGPLAAPEPLPPLAQPQDPAAQFPDEPFTAPGGQQPGPGTGQAPAIGDPAALQALADALRDQSVTRQVAESLDQGDLAGAAQGLRELADQAGQISQQARNDLGSALRRAASQVEASSPDLAAQLRASADGLQSRDDAQAAQALEDLAGAVEQMGAGQAAQPGDGQQPGAAQSPGQGQPDQGQQGQGSSGAGDSSLPGEQRAQTSERLGVDGVPLELDAQGDATTPAQGQASGDDGGNSDGGNFSQGGASLGTDPVQAADDPQLIPADLRDVVQDYFSP
ncbi:hypothetical protein K2Z83_00735 [Oscillochloris sp. ZM17-4]|uniref:hypothetical protein n=1 Tax=Oscillochloris sp. ZM17-4 TaxID=2866714 RepID=UPI001C739AB3|nr:hypothetical protein [Oscillochloris sp. ZM17-4]MBX0326218.1 hypothetical protein [Oscillochloris sp. ZM17-4]